MLARGVTLTVLGKRSSDPKERRMKAERIIIDGKPMFTAYMRDITERKQALETIKKN